MQVLSVRQPWAWAIARGHKTIVNRGRDTGLRGEVAVHSSLRVDLEAFDDAVIRSANWDPEDPEAAIGGIVAVVRLGAPRQLSLAARAAAAAGVAGPDDRPARPLGTRAAGRGRRGQAAARSAPRPVPRSAAQRAA